MFLLGVTRAGDILFFYLAGITLRPASPKYVGWASRLETQEELMLQFKSEGCQARDLGRSKGCCWQNFFLLEEGQPFALIG